MANKYRGPAQWVFPIGGSGMKIYLTDGQMKEVVNSLLTDKPLPNIHYSGGGFAGMDPRVNVQSFYSKDHLLKIYNEERPKVKVKKKTVTPPQVNESKSLAEYGINLNP